MKAKPPSELRTKRARRATSAHTNQAKNERRHFEDAAPDVENASAASAATATASHVGRLQHDALSPYELERAARMRENARKLVVLGLAAAVPAADPLPPQRRRQTARASQLASRRSEPSRRSSRLKPATVKAERSILVAGFGPPCISDDDDDDHDQFDAAAPRAVRAPLERPPPPPNSCRTATVDVTAILASHLGRRMPGRSTKESVVQDGEPPSCAASRRAQYRPYLHCSTWIHTHIDI